MQLVIENGFVVATFADKVALPSGYDACEVISHPGIVLPPDGRYPDPRRKDAYSVLRAMNYPSIVEQLDMLYWDTVNGTHVRPDTLAAVKAQSPKPESSDVPLTLDVARRRKLAALSAWKIGMLARGFDTGLGFTVGIADTDQHTFASYTVLLDTLVQAGQRTLDSQVVIGDIHGDPYSITIAQFKATVLAYGAFCEFFFQQGAVAYSHLMRAATIEEVDAIQLPQ